MFKKLKYVVPAFLLSIALAGGAAPAPVSSRAVITAEAAAKPSISKKRASLGVRQTLQLKIKNNKKKIKWSSSNKKVAAVSSKGLVTAKKAGRAKITAKIGKKKYYCNITVKNIRIKSLKLSGTSSLETGKTAKLQVAVSPYNASNQKIKWTSSNSSVISVASDGTLTARKKGAVYITAKATDGSGKKARKKVYAVQAKTSPAPNPGTNPTPSQTPSSAPSPAPSQTENTSIRYLAPKADECVLHAFEYLGFTIEKNSYANYSGYFSVEKHKIYLKRLDGTTIYHELGHFLAWFSGDKDSTSDFISIYQREKEKVISANKPYIIQNSSEYFAESYRDYILTPSALRSQRPLTYNAIRQALNVLNTSEESRLVRYKTAYDKAFWKQ